MEGKSFPEKDAAQTGFLITALPFASRRRGLPHRSWPLLVGTPDKIPILSDRSAILALCSHTPTPPSCPKIYCHHIP